MEIQDQIISILSRNPGLSLREIHERLASDNSYSTTKRTLVKLIDKKLVDQSGNKRSSTYNVGKSYQILHSMDSEAYFEKDIDDRKIQETFNFALIQKELFAIELFTDEEGNKLNELQTTYSDNVMQLSKTEYDKEIERLAIDLSWKSSQIEGNTYTLLETEQLLKEKQTAAGKHKDEAVMLLNHKEAIDFIVAHPDYLQTLSIRAIEDIHSILTKELGISRKSQKPKGRDHGHQLPTARQSVSNQRSV